MRKITLKHTKRKKDRMKQFIVWGVLFIMLFSTIGYSFLGRESESIKKLDYNGFEFTNQNGFWLLNIGNLEFAFKYNPNEVEEINSELKYLDNYYEKPLYIFSESNEATSEIYTNLNQVVLRMQPACLEEDILKEYNVSKECDKTLPTKTCEDNFIIISETNDTKLIQDKNCVFIQDRQENLLKITDEFLFQTLGIKNKF
jgi:hypothetical protein